MNHHADLYLIREVKTHAQAEHGQGAIKTINNKITADDAVRTGDMQENSQLGKHREPLLSFVDYCYDPRLTSTSSIL